MATIRSIDNKTPSAELYTAAQVRALDQAIIASGVPGIQLMKRAAKAAFEVLLARFGQPDFIQVYAGGGNNGGDGYVLAGLAAERRIPVEVIALVAPEKLTGDAQLAWQFARQAGVSIHAFADATRPSSGVVVDALLGIGFSGELRSDMAAAIEQINASGLPVLALDIPSGLNADTGAAVAAAVRATATVTFIGIKCGLVSGRGPALCGELVLADLELSQAHRQGIAPSATLLRSAQCLELLQRRAADAHKGDFGHVMVIGGDTGYGGAALMAAEAAARVGAGLVSVATRPEHVAAILARRPEVMACGVISGQELEPLLARPGVLVIGPGLGRSPWSEQMLQQAMKSGLPMVVDADALNIMAAGRVVPEGTRRNNWILTPHPGEAARLLNTGTADVQQQRYQQVTALHQQYGGAVILKGAGSLVTDAGGEIGVVTAGNPGMASGGMGDILSGLLGGLLAQGLSVGDAARLGACLHAEAADRAALLSGERSLLATDLLPQVCELLRGH